MNDSHRYLRFTEVQPVLTQLQTDTAWLQSRVNDLETENAELKEKIQKLDTENAELKTKVNTVLEVIQELFQVLKH